VQRTIEIKKDSGRVAFQDLRIDLDHGAGGLDGDGGNLDGGLESEEEGDDVRVDVVLA
jgi:hypothetical protein